MNMLGAQHGLALIELAQEAGPLGFFSLNRPQDRLAGSTGLARLLGRQAAPFESTLASFIELLYADDRSALQKGLQDAVAHPGEATSLNCRVTWPDGSTHWLSVRLIVPDRESLPDLLGVLFDVSAQQRAELAQQALLRSEQVAVRQAEAVAQAQDEFVSTLSHELRTPLSAISAGVEVLQRAGVSETVARRARDIIARQTRQLAHMVSDLPGVVGVMSSGFQPRGLAASASHVAVASSLSRAHVSHSVLVVEDNPDAQQTLCDFLALDGHGVTATADGISGLDMLVKQRPQIAIIDIGLPGLDGFGVAVQARAAGYGGHLIAVSGNGHAQDAQRALHAGFDAHMAKPVDMEELRRLMSIH